MIQSSLCNSSITAGCGILPRSIAVGCWCIGARNIPFWIGAFFGIVALGAALKADNIRTTIEVIETPSRAVVVSRTVEEAWTVGTIIRSWCKAWLLRRAINLLRSRGK